ncbi:MAG: DUF4160 domain-containing protein [Victivallales bacterium]|jgi:hypothetical protein|nr:DUF4160 domain-containing protein [Victivallales bacterium]MBR6075583.1 DUF4160 domain-containing protein [Victivallales bacterium]
MPVISLFYGIIVEMFYNEHIPPHFHARHGEDRAVIDIASGDVLEGELSRRDLRLVEAWLELNRESLMANWQLAREGREMFKIAPLG